MPTPSLDDPARFRVIDQTTGRETDTAGTPHGGPIPGPTDELVIITPHNLAISAVTENVFIRSGSGDDQLDVSAAGGTNVLNPGTGNNIVIAGPGHDIIMADARQGDIYDVIRGFGPGDAVVVLGMTSDRFWLERTNDMVPASPGLNLTLTGTERPSVVHLDLPDYRTDDLSQGRLTVCFGHTESPGRPPLDYMVLQAS